MPQIKTTVVGSYPVMDWLTALPSRQALTDATAVPLPLSVVPDSEVPADAAAWAAALPPSTPVAGFPAPKVSDATWNSYPANRLSDRAVDLHLATLAARALQVGPAPR